MNRKSLNGVIAFVCLFFLGLILQYLAEQGILRMFLFFGSFLIIGLISTSIRRSFLLSFIITFSLTIFEYFLIFGTTSTEASTTLIILTLTNSLFGGFIGAVGNVLGRRMP